MSRDRPTGAFAFELPFGNREVATELIASIPPDWSWITGQLDAPVQAALEGRVGLGGYVIDRYGGVGITTMDEVGRDRFWQMEVAERSSLIANRRQAGVELTTQQVQPLFVRFREAGFDQGEYGSAPFEQVKRIAIHYVQQGYLGDLFFHSDCYDDCGSYNPEYCALHLAPFSARWRRFEDEPGPMPTHAQAVEAYRSGDAQRIAAMRLALDPPKRQYPALIKAEWHAKYGGRAERVQGILETCRAFGLGELDPEPIDYGSSYADPLVW